MTKQKMLESNDNFVTAEIKRREAKDGKRIRKPLGANEISLNNIQIETNGIEIEYGNNSQYLSEELSKMGLVVNSEGMVIIKTEDHYIDRDDNGKIVRIKDNKIIRMNRNVVPIREEEQEENEIA